MLPGSREGSLLNLSRAELVARRMSQLVFVWRLFGVYLYINYLKIKLNVRTYN